MIKKDINGDSVHNDNIQVIIYIYIYIYMYACIHNDNIIRNNNSNNSYIIYTQ